MKKFTFQILATAEIQMIGRIDVNAEDEADAREHLLYEADWQREARWDFGPDVDWVGALDEEDIDLLHMEEMVDGEEVA